MTSYTVTAERGAGPVWVFQCLELPGAISESRRLRDADRLMREAIGFVAEVDPVTVELTVVPQLGENLAREVADAREAAAASREVQERSGALSRAAVRDLLSAGLTGADIATILGLSPQRVSQLAAGQVSNAG